ncbi:DNA primase [Rhodobacterales bacterium FZCC0069]|nr:DNA primase [Rhodobacterales bacterium FZCC0069]
MTGTWNVSPAVSRTAVSQNEAVAQAACDWLRLGIKTDLHVNGMTVADPRKETEQRDPIATYHALTAYPQKLGLSLKTGRQTGILAISVYTHGPGTGLAALHEKGWFYPQHDTAIRHEVLLEGTLEGCFHTLLYHSGNQDFVETSLAEYPGLTVRKSGEVVLIPPHEMALGFGINLVNRLSYECKDEGAPSGITKLPDGLRDAIRAAERGIMPHFQRGAHKPGVMPDLFKPIAEGERNTLLTQRAGLLIGARKLNENDALAVLLDINKRCCTPPLDESEVRSIVKSISKRSRRHG